MANYTTNEEYLISYLKEQHSETKSQIEKELKIQNYWSSGDYQKDMVGTPMTNHQIDFYIINCEKRIKPLRFRMMWLEAQINQFDENISDELNRLYEWREQAILNDDSFTVQDINKEIENIKKNN